MKMKKYIKILIIIIILIIITLIAINAEYTGSKVKSIIISSSVDDSPGDAPKNTFPLILFHGFNPTYSPRLSEFILRSMQNKLSQDLDYRNKGLFTSETTCAELRYSKIPIIIRATYLKQFELLEIEDYSKNVDKIILKVKYCTGADKVDVITYSMGGIVVRYYIKNIDNSSIRRLILLGTPNHGGLYNIGWFANYLVEDGKSRINLDFIELSENHDFMKSLNSGDETIGDIEYYTIAGEIDQKGDGLILSESVSLDGENAHLVVPCRHSLMNLPFICPDAYTFIKEVFSS
ncbi:hypothetical protein CMO89_01775 [Candidatus Woesearchaeota archaeon]|nr:hypothetical protein [Candidatus Woesearchaeota archaeon]|tara:strand:- start:2817 stop:3689 length:873 start_codon:yes stop_codon:yes gene_type:complete